MNNSLMSEVSLSSNVYQLRHFSYIMNSMANPHFSHDFYSRSNPKLLAIEMKYGRDGRMTYWDIIEVLHERGGYLLLADAPSIAFGLRTTVETLLDIITNFNLFQFDDNREFFYSERCLRNVNKVKDLIEKKINAGKASAERRASSKLNSTPVQHLFNTCSTPDGNVFNKNPTEAQQNPTILNQTKLNKTKLKEKKDINIPFSDFWDLYDKKVDAAKCEKKWNALTDEERSQAMQYIPKYVLSTPDKKYRKNPETFINNKSFKNEIIDINGGHDAIGKKSTTDANGRGGSIDEYAAAAATWQRGNPTSG